MADISDLLSGPDAAAVVADDVPSVRWSEVFSRSCSEYAIMDIPCGRLCRIRRTGVKLP